MEQSDEWRNAERVRRVWRGKVGNGLEGVKEQLQLNCESGQVPSEVVLRWGG